MKNSVAKPESDAELNQFLNELVPRVFGHKGEISRVERTACPFASFYDCTILEIVLVGGERRRIFWKDFSSYPREKDGLPERRLRELRVYRDLLSSANLKTANYYGSVWDDSTSRFWLFIEHVDGTRVRYCDIGYWLEAARWLAQMQCYFARHIDELEHCEFLLKYDQAFFQPVAQSALEAVRAYCQGSVPVYSSIVERYSEVSALMSAEPYSFLHGAFRPGQILLDANRDPPRLCTVDWELAGIGSSLFDLAELTFGFREDQVDEFIAVYRDELNSEGDTQLILGDDDMRLRIDCFHLHRVLRQLGKARVRQFPVDQVEKLIRMVVSYWELIRPRLDCHSNSGCVKPS